MADEEEEKKRATRGAMDDGDDDEQRRGRRDDEFDDDEDEVQSTFRVARATRRKRTSPWRSYRWMLSFDSAVGARTTRGRRTRRE